MSARLMLGMLQISGARSWHRATKTILEFSQLLTQAMLPGQSPLLQLPYINNEIIERFSRQPRKIKSIKEFLEMEENERKDIVKLNPKEYDILLRVASKFPVITVSHAVFRVPGEPFIVPSSLVTLTVKFDCQYGTNTPPVQDLPPLETTQKVKNKWWQSDNASEYAHTFLPISTRPIWHVSLSNPQIDRLICSKNVVGNTHLIHMEFQAPPETGTWKFLVSIKSNTFVNTDYTQTIKLEVKQPSNTFEINDKEFESSSDEEEEEEKVVKEKKKKEDMGEFEDSDDSDDDHSSHDGPPEDFVE